MGGGGSFPVRFVIPLLLKLHPYYSLVYFSGGKEKWKSGKTKHLINFSLLSITILLISENQIRFSSMKRCEEAKTIALF